MIYICIKIDISASSEH